MLVTFTQGHFLNPIITLARQALQSRSDLPFSLYSAQKVQTLANVPVAKPLLIIILSGTKQLGDHEQAQYGEGEFVFLSNHSSIDMRNIPSPNEYCALLIEFDFDDFAPYPVNQGSLTPYLDGKMPHLMEQSLTQLLHFATLAPHPLINRRKNELLDVLYHSGYAQLGKLAQAPNVSAKVFSLIQSDLQRDWTLDVLSEQVYLSPTTLRRKLKAEETSIADLKSRARLGHALHLLQTTSMRIGDIAQQCGFHSQSRFTDQFKRRFSMTPRELRKSRMADE